MPNQQNLNSTSSQESSGKTVVKAMWDGATTGLSVLIFALAILIVGVPAVVGGMPLIVLSGSMQPVYKPGDLVVVRSIGASEIRIGDVITYQLRSSEPELITHRVIERSNTIGGEVTFITKGDANPSADEDPVREVQVRGTVWYRIPLLGWVNNIITGQTREWLIPAVAAALIAYAFWNFGKELHNRRKS